MYNLNVRRDEDIKKIYKSLINHRDIKSQNHDPLKLNKINQYIEAPKQGPHYFLVLRHWSHLLTINSIGICQRIYFLHPSPFNNIVMYIVINTKKSLSFIF